MQYRYDNFYHSYLTGDQMSSLVSTVYSELGDAFPDDTFLSTENQLMNQEKERYSALKSRGNGKTTKVLLKQK